MSTERSIARAPFDHLVDRTTGKSSGCRWCGGPVPKGRRTFCGDACVQEFNVRRGGTMMRNAVLLRDKGVCAVCGRDCVALKRSVPRGVCWQEREAFLRAAGFTRCGNRVTLWDVDHIVPVLEGGGACDLSNLRTLCIPCHRRVTAEMRARIAGKKRSPA